VKAEEIRNVAKLVDEACKGPEMDGLSAENKAKALLTIAGGLAFSMICEVAAQLAQFNDDGCLNGIDIELEKLNATLKPRWVKLLTADNSPYWVDANKVVSVTAVDRGDGKGPQAIINDDWRHEKMIFESFDQVCTKGEQKRSAGYAKL
jgi:hypothetical protein